MSIWPTDSKQVMIEAFYRLGDDPFIYGAIGKINAQAMADMEADMKEYSEELFTKGDGDYLFEAGWNQGDWDQGQCIYKPYWELTAVDFRPMEYGE